MRRALALAVILATVIGCRPKEERKRVVIATTPRILATGLPQQLAKAFVAESHVGMDVRSVDGAQFAQATASGSADVAIVGSDDAQAAIRSDGTGRLVNTFAYDDYIIVGPSKDPARVRHAATAADAFRSIVKHDQSFCSPAEVEGIREREAVIWTAAAVDPHQDKRYRICKGDAATVLRESSSRDAYTLTDRATLDTVRVHLAPLLEKTAMLHNDFTVILLARPDHNRNAEWFVQWLMSYRGRDVVENYRFEGGRRFYPSETK